jgi:hypothetical protein
MTVVTALALLISKVLDKARVLSAKFFEEEVVQTVTEPGEEKTPEKNHNRIKCQSRSIIS